MDFISHQAEKILACYTDSSLSSCLNKAEENDLEKGGEGTHGGKVIGHTKSGKPIYEKMNTPDYKHFTSTDHREATELHLNEAKKYEHSDPTKGKAHWNEAWKHDRVGNRKEIQEKEK